MGVARRRGQLRRRPLTLHLRGIGDADTDDIDGRTARLSGGRVEVPARSAVVVIPLSDSIGTP